MLNRILIFLYPYLVIASVVAAIIVSILTRWYWGAIGVVCVVVIHIAFFSGPRFFAQGTAANCLIAFLAARRKLTPHDCYVMVVRTRDNCDDERAEQTLALAERFAREQFQQPLRLQYLILWICGTEWCIARRRTPSSKEWQQISKGVFSIVGPDL